MRKGSDVCACAGRPHAHFDNCLCCALRAWLLLISRQHLNCIFATQHLLKEIYVCQVLLLGFSNVYY
jgi:hypothetical protein